MLMWWDALTIPAPGRQRQEDPEFQASLGSIERPHLEQKQRFCTSLVLHEDEPEIQFCQIDVDHIRTHTDKGEMQ